MDTSERGSTDDEGEVQKRLDFFYRMHTNVRYKQNMTETT